ncbi:MAG TPA: LysR family transcriptional regulator [Bordetella sp.]
MKIEALHTLEAILHTGTFAQAALERNVTRSAVSMQVKQLELYVGQPLFDRSGLYARPTSLARELVYTMHDALARLETLRKRPSVAVEGIVRLGVIESMQPIVLPGTLKWLAERHPRLEIRPARGRSSTLMTAVRSGELDAALVAQPPEGASARLRWQPMLSRELMLLAPPEAGEASVQALFRLYPWIRYDRKTVSGSVASHYVAQQIGDVRGALEFDSATAILAMVSAGLGVAVIQLSEPALLQSYPVRIVRLGRNAPSIQYSLVSRRGDEGSRALQAMHDAMQSALVVARHPKRKG